MSEHAAFLRAIIETPADDLPRLIYADWLDERGDPRGEFIRVQIELAKPVEVTRDELFNETYPGQAKQSALDRLGIPQLKKREQYLLYGIYPIGPAGDSNSTRWVSESLGGEWWLVDARSQNVRWEWSRGFISSITCTAADWLEHADQITASAPIEKVTWTSWARVSGWGSLYKFADVAMKPVRVSHALRDRELTETLFKSHWPNIELQLPTETTFDVRSYLRSEMARRLAISEAANFAR